MFALEKHFFLFCVFVLMLVSMIDRHYKNGLVKKTNSHHHKGCHWRQQPCWSIWCQGQQHRCHCQSQLVFSRKHKHVVGFSLCVPSSMRHWYLLIILGLERYSCRFLSINCSFFLLLSLQGYSEMPESTLDTVYSTLLGQVGLSSPSRVRETKKRKWPKKTKTKKFRPAVSSNSVSTGILLTQQWCQAMIARSKLCHS